MRQNLNLTEPQIRSIVSMYQTTKDLRVLEPIMIQFHDMAKTFALRKMPYYDLYFKDVVQEALLAIAVAAMKFDLNSDKPFKDFAPIYMKQAIKEFHNTYSQPITRPKSRKTKLPIEDIEQFIIDGDGDEFEDKVIPECLIVYPPEMEEDPQIQLLHNRLSTLNEFEQTVIKAHFGLNEQPPMDDVQLSECLHTTTERIRHTRSQALNKLHFRMLN